jgi:membrane protease YdiL (CAAX protease family)
MTDKQKIAVGALPVLAVTMFGVFALLAHVLGPKLGWYAGFLVYWPLWCLLFPRWMLGWRRMRDLFQPRRMGATDWVLALFPPLMALIGGLIFAQERRDPSVLVPWVFMAFGNGILEEMLWRGVYVTLFPANKLWGVAWPAVWFALWHFGPGSLHSGVWVLVAGAAGLGVCFGWLAFRTGSIRWCAISHTLSGLFWGLV